jgi:dTDP-4-dehydrorhamnose 3,5-epimerase
VNVTPLNNPDVLLIQPKTFGDHRGYFLETFQVARYAEKGISLPFVQDNLSRSPRGILRGLHLQHPMSQGKLVYVVEGEVFDVAVDLRVGSPWFGQSSFALLSSADHSQLWIPPGFAHGFCVTSEVALFAYKCTVPYAPAHEFSVRFDDPQLGIPWPIQNPMLSEKDRNAPCLAEIDPARLPMYENPK